MHDTETRAGDPATGSDEAQPTAGGIERRSDGESGVTRRSVLRAAGGATAASGGSAAQSQTYRFGGHVEAWEGRAPEPIAGESNPTLQLEAGTEYEVVWENLDGVIHNFVIQNADGRELAATEDVTEEGATASVTFTATAEMAQYICVYHQSTMVGDIEVEGEAAAAAGDGAGEDGPNEGGLADGEIPLEVVAVAGSVPVLFLSPLLFALFLFTRRRSDGGDGGAPN